jgi:hypothetical protein
MASLTRLLKFRSVLYPVPNVFCWPACSKRVTNALRSVSDQFIRCPNAEEDCPSANRSDRSNSEYHFPHFVGIADSTLFPLAFAPESEDAPDYLGRENGYSLTIMIICDHTRRIQHYLAGSQEVLMTIELSRLQNCRSQSNISRDSAFENSWFMVSASMKQ